MGTIFSTLYFLQLPFFERYKAEAEPWPWQADWDKWRSLMIRTACLIGFNLLVLIPTIGFSQCFLGVPVNLDFRLHTVPSVGRFFA